jgi:hypothetical protein
LGLLTVLLLFPLYRERAEYLALGNMWKRETEIAFREDGGSIEALLSALEERTPGRIYAGRAANWGDEYRIGAVPVYALLSANQFDSPGHLYHALSLNADIEGYLDESRPATFNLFNLRYVVAPEGQSVPVFARHQASYGTHWLYRVDTTGYFDLVDSDLILYGEREAWFEAAVSWLQTDLVEAKQHPAIRFGSPPMGEVAALPLDAAPALLTGLSLPQRGPCGQISGEQIAGNRYTTTFEAERSCWLIFKTTYHPGWQVTLDGRPVEPEMLMPSFVGLPVGPGRHLAEFHYRPGPLRLWLSIAGLGVLCIAVVVEWQHQRWGRWVASRVWVVGLKEVQERGRLRLKALFSGMGRGWQWPVLLLSFVLLAGLPMLQFKVMSGHDALEYLPRTIEFYRGLQEGHLLPRWAPDLGNGYGYPFFIFNPPLVYYVASLFHALGTSVVVALNLTCLLMLTLAGLGMYFFAKELFGQAGGLAAGVAYVLAPFTLVNLYVRHAFADYTAMAFIPWAFWGLYRWMPLRPFVPGKKGTSGHFLVAVGAVVLLILSSNPVALVVVPLLGLYVLFLAWRARSWRSLRRGLGALILGVGMAAFFWLPALVERNWVKTGQLLTGYLNYRNHFVYLHQLVYSSWGYGLSLPGPEDQMSFRLGVVQIILIVVSTIFARRFRDRLDKEHRAHFWFFLGLLGLVAFLVTDNSIWLWDTLPLLQYLGFPWRILVMAAVSTAVICGFSLVLVGKVLRRWLLAGILAGLFVFGMPHAKPEGYFDVIDADYAPEIIASQGLAVTTTREYEPIWAGMQPEGQAPPNRLLLLSGQVRVLESNLTGTRYEWLLEAAGPAALRVATFYYPGWQLTVDDQPRIVTVQNPYGLIDFSLEPGTHRVHLSFEPTPLRQGAGWGSLGILLLTALIALWPRLRKLWERRIA